MNKAFTVLACYIGFAFHLHAKESEIRVIETTGVVSRAIISNIDGIESLSYLVKCKYGELIIKDKPFVSLQYLENDEVGLNIRTYIYREEFINGKSGGLISGYDAEIIIPPTWNWIQRSERLRSFSRHDGIQNFGIESAPAKTDILKLFAQILSKRVPIHKEADYCFILYLDGVKISKDDFNFIIQLFKEMKSDDRLNAFNFTDEQPKTPIYQGKPIPSPPKINSYYLSASRSAVKSRYLLEYIRFGKELSMWGHFDNGWFMISPGPISIY